MMNEGAWEKLALEKQNLQPTPPVGEPVVWYMSGDKNKPVAAQCNGIEGPGRIYVAIFQKNGFTLHRGACHHISSPTHKQPNVQTKEGGAWDYPRHNAPAEDFDFHKAEIEKRETALFKAEEDAEKNRLLFEQKAAERAAGIKKRMVDILPKQEPKQKAVVAK